MEGRPQPEQQVSDYQKPVYDVADVEMALNLGVPSMGFFLPGTLPYPYPRVNALDSPI